MHSMNPDQLPTGDEKVAAVQSMFDAVAPRYDLVNRVMTFGMDTAWRRKTLRILDAPAASIILDLACGTGDFCRELTDAGHRPIGADLSFGMLANARTDAPLVQGDALNLSIADGAVDGVTCGMALRNFVELDGFFDEVARVVRPGGRAAFLEVAEPSSRFMRFGFNLYFNKVVPVIGGALSDRAAYRYLPKSVVYLPPPEEMLARFAHAGFTNVTRTLVPGGLAQILSGTRTTDG